MRFWQYTEETGGNKGRLGMNNSKDDKVESTKENIKEDLNHILQARYDKLSQLKEQGKDPYLVTKYTYSCHTADIVDSYEQYESKEVSVAGRLMSKRIMGKASFCNILDLTGRIQSYVARDSIGEEAYAEFKKFDIGDRKSVV